MRVADPFLESGNSIMSITIIPVNDAPTVSVSTTNISFLEDVGGSILVTSADIDSDNYTLTVNIPPAFKGTLKRGDNSSSTPDIVDGTQFVYGKKATFIRDL